MNRLFLIWFSIFASLLSVSCADDEDTLTPSGEEKNWRIIEDSEDPIDHLRYTIFRDYQVPIYYNDTIGSMTRYNFKGQPYTYYEVLRVFYAPGSAKPNANVNYYVLLEKENKSCLEVMLEDVRDQVVAKVQDKIYIPSLLLVDTLKSLQSDLVYRGFNSIAIGDARRYARLEEEERVAFMDSVLAAIISYDVYANYQDFLKEDFFILSEQVNPKAPLGVYNVYIRKACEGSSLPQTCEALGFLAPQDPTKPVSLQMTPTYSQDVDQYCNAIFALSEQEFLEKYENDEVVLAKYQVLRSFLKIKYGFSFE